MMLVAAVSDPPAQSQPQSLARISSIPMQAGFRVEDALTIDIDNDGVADLVIQSASADVRRLSIHLRRASGPAFLATADATLDLTPDVVCFAAADVHADPGREIVLFNATGAFAWRWRSKDESQRYQKLCACDLLWQWPDPKKAFAWQAAVADLDGDGLDDLAVPEPGRYALVLQRKAESGARTFASVVQHVSPGAGRDLAAEVERSAEVRQPGGKRRANVSITENGVQVDSGRLGPAPYLWVRESVPAGQIVDFDGDGDKDLLFQESGSINVYVQDPKGVFSTTPLVLQNPVTVDRQRALDVSYTAKTLDLDGDRRVDCIISAGDKRSDATRTQMLVFLARAVKQGEPPLFGAAGVPSQLLVLDGFARPLAIEDVDGDGKPDLVAGAIRPDLIDGLRAAATERVDAEVYVYRNTGNGFSKQPDLVHKLSIKAGGLDLTARFAGDVTGDGISDFFERADKDVLRVHMVRRTRDAFAVIDPPVYSMPLADDAHVLMPGHIGNGSWDLFVIEKEAVRCASFR
jgi:hypothetical protein